MITLIHFRSSLVDPSAGSSRWDPGLNLSFASFDWSSCGVVSFDHTSHQLAQSLGADFSVALGASIAQPMIK